MRDDLSIRSTKLFFHVVFPPWLTVRRTAFAVEVAHPLTTVRHG